MGLPELIIVSLAIVVVVSVIGLVAWRTNASGKQ